MSGSGHEPEEKAYAGEDKMSEIAGRVMNTGSIIDYQEGSVVSRSVIDKKSGTVTLFAFDRGQGLSEHTAPFDALVEIVDGEAEVTISGEKHTVGKGQMIIMPAGEAHSLRADMRFKMLLIMIKK